jgi:aminopeptidase N
MAWVQTTVPVFSDFAGIEPVGKLILYNRFLWSFISVGVFLIGFLCRRSYEQNLFNSIKSNMKNKSLVALLATILCCAVFVIIKEPYINKHPRLYEEEYTVNTGVQLTDLNPEVIIYNEKAAMAAKVNYKFKNNNESEYIQFHTNEGLKVKEVKVNNEISSYKKVEGTNIIEIPIPKVENISLEICYEGKIKYDSYYGFAGYICRESIYLLECSNWVFRPLTSQKAFIDIYGSITAGKNLSVVTPGELISVTEEEDTKKWNYKLKSASSDIGVFAGEYTKYEFSFEDTSIEFYYSPKHEEYVKGRNIEKHIKNMMSFYSESFGPYYTKEYPLKIVEAACYKPGGHSSINVVTFAEYMINREIFEKDLYTEQEGTDIDYNLVHDMGIISHEISHQWWGTAVDAVEEMPWSNEGLAEYSSYKYLVKEFGEAYSYMLYSGWESYFNDSSKGYYMKNPKSLKALNEKFRKGIEMENKQMQLYNQMPLQLVKAEKLMGEEVFIDNLSKIYKNHFMKKLTYEEFLNEMNLTEEAISLE